MRHVLIVDDDRDTLDAATDALTQLGVHVRGARDGEEALYLLRDDPLPDVIILNLRMRRISGVAFRKAQLADPRIAAVPVVLTTTDTPKELEEVPDLPVLKKPFTLEQLFAAIGGDNQ